MTYLIYHNVLKILNIKTNTLSVKVLGKKLGTS